MLAVITVFQRTVHCCCYDVWRPLLLLLLLVLSPLDTHKDDERARMARRRILLMCYMGTKKVATATSILLLFCPVYKRTATSVTSLLWVCTVFLKVTRILVTNYIWLSTHTLPRDVVPTIRPHSHSYPCSQTMMNATSDTATPIQVPRTPTRDTIKWQTSRTRSSITRPSVSMSQIAKAAINPTRTGRQTLQGPIQEEQTCVHILSLASESGREFHSVDGIYPRMLRLERDA